LDSVTFIDPAVAAISKSIVFSKFDADKDTILAKTYGITGFPTMVLIKPNGTEIDRLVGFYPPEEFVPALFDIMQNRNTLDDYLTRLANHPDSHALRIEVAEKYQYRSMNVPATMHYDYIIFDDPENLQGFSDNSMLALGRMELKAEHYSDAIDMFNKLQERYPDSELFEEANIYVPYTYMKADEDKKAIEYFEVFKTEFPESEDIEWVDKKIAEIKEGKK
jgi:tetratricopeptide (TPR) repeat protein